MKARNRAAPIVFLLGLVPWFIAASAGATPPYPHALAPLPDFELEAGTFLDPAAFLSDHFETPPGANIDYWTVRVTPAGDDAGAGATVYAAGDRLVVAAPDARWAGESRVTLEACAVVWPDLFCTSSNPFLVRVTPSATGPDAGTTIIPSIGVAASGSAAVLSAEFDPLLPPTSEPRWFLGGQFLGAGSTVRVEGLPPGEYRVFVLFETAAGPQSASGTFRISAISGGWDGPTILAASAAILMVGVFVLGPSRTRTALLLLIVGAATVRNRAASPLDHFTRGALHQLVKDNPGIHFSVLRQRVDISHGSAIHHLRVLEEAGYVRCLHVGAYTTYFATDKPLDPSTYGLSPVERQVLHVVGATPGVSLQEIAERTNRSLGTTSRTVSNLAALGFVVTRRQRRRVHVFVRPAGELPFPVTLDESIPG